MSEMKDAVGIDIECDRDGATGSVRPFHRIFDHVCTPYVAASNLVFMLLQPGCVLGETPFERNFRSIAQFFFRRRRGPRSLPVQMPMAGTDFNPGFWNQLTNELRSLAHSHVSAA